MLEKIKELAGLELVTPRQKFSLLVQFVTTPVKGAVAKAISYTAYGFPEQRFSYAELVQQQHVFYVASATWQFAKNFNPIDICYDISDWVIDFYNNNNNNNNK